MIENIKLVACEMNCKYCRHLNIKTDNKGYPWEYECMKYGDTVFEKELASIKSFSR